MTSKHQNYLLKTYPGLYRQHKLSMRETCMCWGFECGDGWFKLLDALSRKLVKIYPELQATQVKEKYGTLRFYTGGMPEVLEIPVFKTIELACWKSARTCDVCGEPGKLNNEGWISARCEKHRKG